MESPLSYHGGSNSFFEYSPPVPNSFIFPYTNNHHRDHDHYNHTNHLNQTEHNPFSFDTSSSSSSSASASSMNPPPPPPSSSSSSSSSSSGRQSFHSHKPSDSSTNNPTNMYGDSAASPRFSSNLASINKSNTNNANNKNKYSKNNTIVHFSPTDNFVNKPILTRSFPPGVSVLLNSPSLSPRSLPQQSSLENNAHDPNKHIDSGRSHVYRDNNNRGSRQKTHHVFHYHDRDDREADDDSSRALSDLSHSSDIHTIEDDGDEDDDDTEVKAVPDDDDAFRINLEDHRVHHDSSSSSYPCASEFLPASSVMRTTRPPHAHHHAHAHSGDACIFEPPSFSSHPPMMTSLPKPIVQKKSIPLPSSNNNVGDDNTNNDRHLNMNMMLQPSSQLIKNSNMNSNPSTTLNAQPPSISLSFPSGSTSSLSLSSSSSSSSSAAASSAAAIAASSYFSNRAPKSGVCSSDLLHYHMNPPCSSSSPPSSTLLIDDHIHICCCFCPRIHSHSVDRRSCLVNASLFLSLILSLIASCVTFGSSLHISTQGEYHWNYRYESGNAYSYGNLKNHHTCMSTGMGVLVCAVLAFILLCACIPLGIYRFLFSFRTQFSHAFSVFEFTGVCLSSLLQIIGVCLWSGCYTETKHYDQNVRMSGFGYLIFNVFFVWIGMVASGLILKNKRYQTVSGAPSATATATLSLHAAASDKYEEGHHSNDLLKMQPNKSKPSVPMVSIGIASDHRNGEDEFEEVDLGTSIAPAA